MEFHDIDKVFVGIYNTLTVSWHSTNRSPGYTPDMTVEEICERMTLDEARNYVVNSGVCKGWTLAQVAERRAPSLRFYVFSDNGDNVLKAAATIVLNDMGMRKAG